jgi:hypothetical protein
VGAGRGAGHREKLQVAAQSQSGTVVVHAAEEGRGRPMVVLAAEWDEVGRRRLRLGALFRLFFFSRPERGRLACSLALQQT